MGPWQCDNEFRWHVANTDSAQPYANTYDDDDDDVIEEDDVPLKGLECNHSTNHIIFHLLQVEKPRHWNASGGKNFHESELDVQITRQPRDENENTKIDQGHNKP